MLDRYPVYYKEFVCAAGDCPDTCCAGWDVVVDEETAARYAAVEGELAGACGRPPGWTATATG